MVDLNVRFGMNSRITDIIKLLQIDSLVEEKVATLIDIVENKKSLGNKFYFTSTLTKDIIINIDTGEINMYSRKNYNTRVTENTVEVINKITAEITEIFKDGKLDFKDVKNYNCYQRVGSGNYLAVTFAIFYKFNIRVSWVVIAMKYGYDAFYALRVKGITRTKEIHHIDRDIENNSINNLELLTKEEHKNKHINRK